MKDSIQLYSNKDESPGFLRGAIMWRGSVTPRILPILLLMTCYSLLVEGLAKPIKTSGISSRNGQKKKITCPA